MIETNELKYIDDWEDIKSKVKLGFNILIYKSSPRCPISKTTNRTIEIWLRKIPDESKIIYYSMNTLANKELVEKISEDLILTHQSPQIIWIDEDLDVWWHASHYDISADMLNKHLEKFLAKSD